MQQLDCKKGRNCFPPIFQRFQLSMGLSSINNVVSKLLILYPLSTNLSYLGQSYMSKQFAILSVSRLFTEKRALLATRTPNSWVCVLIKHVLGTPPPWYDVIYERPLYGTQVGSNRVALCSPAAIQCMQWQISHQKHLGSKVSYLCFWFCWGLHLKLHHDESSHEKMMYLDYSLHIKSYL